MELFIYNAQLDLIGVLDGATDVIWHRIYHSAGDFEIHTPCTDQAVELLKNQYLITKKDSVEFGIIEVVKFQQSEEGELIIATGHFGSNILSRRIIVEQSTFSTTVESVMRTLVNQCVINPLNANRQIPGIGLGALCGYPELISFQVTYKNLLSTLKSLSLTSGLGYRLRFDPNSKGFIFEVLKGQDRSALQSLNPRCLFSSDFDNLMSSEYLCDEQALSNVALVGGEGEGEERQLVIVGNTQGKERYEVFVNAKDQRKETLTQSEYEAVLAQKGLQSLQTQIERFEGEVDPVGNVAYKIDYDLGDIVTIENNKWDKRIHVRITEITEVFDQNGTSIIPVFGSISASQSALSIQDTSGSASSEIKTLTPNKAVVTDVQGLQVASTITSQELSMLAGVTTLIKDQFSNLWKTIYPIGALYLSTTATNPSGLFGGTWEQIQDKFILAAGATYPAGSTGGAATHNHTSAAHSHTVAAHDHTSAAHTHTINSHSHTSAAHTHALAAHSHTLGLGYVLMRGLTGYLYYKQLTTGVAAWTDTYKSAVAVTASTSQNYSGIALGGSTDTTAFTSNSTTPGSTGTAALTSNSTTPAATGSEALTTDSTTPAATGSGSSLPPYLSVYVFKRTA